jgi:hypothetical protein
MNGSEKRDTSLPAFRDKSDQRHLLAYCAGSGILGTLAATVMSLAATGIARIAIWTAVLGSVSLLAGLAYGPGPLNLLRLVRQAGHRTRDHA